MRPTGKLGLRIALATMSGCSLRYVPIQSTTLQLALQPVRGRGQTFPAADPCVAQARAALLCLDRALQLLMNQTVDLPEASCFMSYSAPGLQWSVAVAAATAAAVPYRSARVKICRPYYCALNGPELCSSVRGKQVVPVVAKDRPQADPNVHSVQTNITPSYLCQQDHSVCGNGKAFASLPQPER